jgi:hypothetical protein
MKRWMLVYLMLLLTGTVNAAPMAQAVEVDVPPWAAVGGGAALVAWVLVSLINRSPKNGNDALVKLADNQAEAIRLDRERFEAQKADDKERNANIAKMLAMSEKDHERMHNSEAAHARLVGEDILAKKKLAESIDAMNAEDTRHNKEVENRVTAIESTLGQVQADIVLVKLSVGPNAAAKLDGVEKAFARLAEEFHALVTALEDAKPQETITEVSHEQTTITVDTVTASAALLPAADAPGPRADAGADGGRDA